MKLIPITYSFLILLTLTQCSPKSEKAMADQPVNTFQIFDLSNSKGMTMKVTNFGGRIISLIVPDKNGEMVDVTLGHDSLERYKTDKAYLGALIGRFGNRIANAKFALNGKEYPLVANNGKNTLHGGPGGFHNVFWNCEPMKVAGNDALVLTYLSKDGEEGYPGNLNVKVTYTLSDQNELVIDYEATTDQPTVVNLTQHAYFNLAGAGNGDNLNHQVEIFADKFLPVDDGLIPTGELRNVVGTPFDFLTKHAIGERINSEDEQIKLGKGYDHCYVLNKPKVDSLTLAARVTETGSGIVMEVLTTEPAIQYYTGNFLDGSVIGKGAKPYGYRSAFCLETQEYPDAPNQSKFPSPVLNPGETLKERTIYKFGVVQP